MSGLVTNGMKVRSVNIKLILILMASITSTTTPRKIEVVHKP